MDPVSFSNRRVRYGTPIAVIILGILFAAADTSSLGNTVATVAIAGGLIWFMVLLGREIGMGERSGRRPHVVPPPEDSRALGDHDRPPDTPDAR